MKRFLLLPALLFLFGGAFAQTYTHPTLGVQSTYLGSCLVSTCSGTYFDNGGSAGAYAPNVNSIYRTFCPNTAGMCMRATFTSFAMNDTYFLCNGPNSCCDYLQILNGPAQNSPALYNNCLSSPGTITASNPSGCLTFRFISDGSVQQAGWAATLSCVPCAGGPSGTTNSDCSSATPICSNTALNDASVGPGINAEGCSGCNTSEVYTNWYRVQVATSGTLAFTIDPNMNTDDFDPVVYGPNVTCGALGAPVRCSYAASSGNGNTGLGNAAVDNSEDVYGDQWVSPINATAGQVYYILINGWSATSGSNGFNLSFIGTATLNCSVLPAEFLAFEGSYSNGMNDIYFATDGEFGVKSFTLEKLDGQNNWQAMNTFAANGNNSMYFFTDAKPYPGSNRYRIRMEEQNGNVNWSHEIEVVAPIQHTFSVFPNPASTHLEVELFDVKGIRDQITIVDAMGKVHYQSNVDVPAGLTIYHAINLGDFAKGIYFVKMGNESKSFVKE